jgi:CheY-like chemotaxis protein
VLVVDDSVDHRTLIARAAAAGMQVDGGHAEEALAAGDDVDLVLLDYRCPASAASTCCAAIRDRPGLRR